MSATCSKHTAAIQRETERNLNAGMQQVTIKYMASMLSSIGYRFDRSMDTRSIAQIISGPHTGDSFPTCILFPVQVDDGKSAYHYLARRDDNYERLKEIRNSFFAVSDHHIFVI